MKVSKIIFRKIVFPILMSLNVDKLIRLFSNKRILNVMYHGVTSLDETDFSPRHITEKQFEQHLKYFKKNFNIIRLSDSEKSKKSRFKKSITISFDDGFKNNLTIVLPLIEKYQIPVTFFISSICTEEMKYRFLWSELIAGLKYFYKDQIIKIEDKEYKNLIDSENNSLIDHIKKLSPIDRELLLSKIEIEYNLVSRIQKLPSEIWQLLNKKELIELSKSNLVDIGSHGNLHYNLGDIPLADAQFELQVSKQKLENAINKKISSIAYPDGSYTEDVKNIAESIGYEHQFAVNYLSEEDKLDKRIQNRHGVSSTTTFESNMLSLSLAFISKGL